MQTPNQKHKDVPERRNKDINVRKDDMKGDDTPDMIKARGFL